MIGYRYTKTGSPIQVGGMTSLGTGTAAITVSGFIEVQDVTGSGAYVAYGSSAPAADGTTAGSFYVPPYGVTRPFAVPSGQTQVRGSASINVRSLG